ncbi:helix-turn-helix domain-containing protein [Deinococcus sp.]|uniref:helix-turn-helix domain-containing protein n=1 Tax=Deinococcus sp. TaxID=47478 RepID=UPI0025EF80F1|nr:helix-turn-helix domain-containing protein [Deinococcus sp.]
MTSTRHEPRALLTIQQAAQLLHVSDDTVRRQIKEGDLPAIHLGTTPKGRPRYRIAREVITRRLDPDQHSANQLSRNPSAAPSASEQLQEVFASLTEGQREVLLTEAIAWARQQQPTLETKGLPPEPSREDLQRRFAQSRLRDALDR